MVVLLRFNAPLANRVETVGKVTRRDSETAGAARSRWASKFEVRIANWKVRTNARCSESLRTRWLRTSHAGVTGQAGFRPRVSADAAGCAARWSSVPTVAFRTKGSAKRLAQQAEAASPWPATAKAANLLSPPTYSARCAPHQKKKRRRVLRRWNRAHRGGDAAPRRESDPALRAAREQKLIATALGKLCQKKSMH